MAVDGDGVPARGLEAGDLVGRIRQFQRSVDGDVVVVPKHDQFVEPQVAGKTDGFLADPLHQTAIAGQHIGVVIDYVAAEFIGQFTLGDCHAHGIGEPLAERSGRGFDAGGMTRIRGGRRFCNRADGNCGSRRS